MKYQSVGLIGHPLGHTMSPYIHKNLFALSNIAHDYAVMDIPALSSEISVLRAMDGFNITIPYKEQIIRFLDGMDQQAAQCGSVNTVVCRNGRMIGHTTDGVGCVKALRDAGIKTSGHILLLGNGGAARAMAFAFTALDTVQSITIVSRSASKSKAQKLKSDLETVIRKRGNRTDVLTCVYEALCEGRTKYDLLLNATSVGMFPDIDRSPVEETVLSRCGGVFDAVYNPIETKLLRQARALGIGAVNGMGMLVYQAAAAHEIWYGAKFQAEDLAKLCRKAELELTKHQNG